MHGKCFVSGLGPMGPELKTPAEDDNDSDDEGVTDVGHTPEDLHLCFSSTDGKFLHFSRASFSPSSNKTLGDT